MPPREPNGRSSLCRSSCSTCKRNLESFEAGLRGRKPGREPRDLAGHRHDIAPGAPSKSRGHRAKLSKLPSAVSSPGSSGFTSRSSANRSRIALLYSARLRRWTAPIRPGFGLRRPGAVDLVFERGSRRRDRWPASGRGIPGGGIEPARSFAITRSHTSGIGARLGQRPKLRAPVPRCGASGYGR